jgi:hypothetical protein
MENQKYTQPELKPILEKSNFNQIYSSGMEYALVSKSGQQLHNFAYCKDFLQDAIHAMFTKKKHSIYGFSYDPTKQEPVDLDVLRLAVHHSTIELSERIGNCLNFLHLIEEIRGFNKTEVYRAEKREGRFIWVFNADPRWMFSSALLSFYTICMRIGFSYKGQKLEEFLSNPPTELGGNDKAYLQGAKEKWKILLSEPIEKLFGKKMEDNYPKDMSVGTMHNETGYVAFTSGRAQNNFKHWLKC